MSLIFWEKQAKYFCGVHAVNNALQNAVFTERHFDTFARKLDEEEKKLGIWSGKSQNKSKNGNYSIQVLSSALSRLNLSLRRIDSEFGKEELTKKPIDEHEVFLCNNHTRAHWFAVRRAGPFWYNLDSLLRGPVRIVDKSVSNFIEKAQKGGYSVFLIEGKLPLGVEGQDIASQVANRGCLYDTSKLELFKPAKKTAGASDDLTRGKFFITDGLKKEKANDLAGAFTSIKNGLSHLMKARKGMKPERRKNLTKTIEDYLAYAEGLKVRMEKAELRKEDEKLAADDLSIENSEVPI